MQLICKNPKIDAASRKLLKYNFLTLSFVYLGKTKDEIGMLKTWISGGIAGVVLWTVIFPADVIKSRQQV